MTNLKKSLILITTSILAWTSSAAVGGDDVIAIGQIFDAREIESTVTVNGQLYLTDDLTSVVNQTGSADSYSDGDYVAITGSLIEPGQSLASSIILLEETYVDGASPVYARVLVDHVDNEIAIAYSGGTVIQFGGALHNADLINLNAGEEADFYGTLFDGQIWATDGLTSNQLESQPQVNGLRGSGVRGLRGSGVRGLRGSGVR